MIIKFFWQGLIPNSSAWELFTREYRNNEILIHRNIVRILDRGKFSGYPFVAMEYFPGGTLRDFIHSRKIIPGIDIISIIGQISDAIDFAHSQGVIHNDLKPGNILFESDSRGRVAISDFGISQTLGAIEDHVTAPIGGWFGSTGYLSPEAIQRNKITKAVDIYSIGIIFFELLTGTLPFNQFQEVYKKIHEDAPDIRTIREVPEAIANRLSKTLSRDPNERPPTARGILAGIEAELSVL